MNYLLKNRIMKKYITLIFLLSTSIIFSQLKMSGKVTDSIGTPLELANIILIDSDSNTLETFAMSDNEGNYKLSLKKNNKYNLQVSYIGMATFSQTLNTGDNDIVTVSYTHLTLPTKRIV